MKEILNRMKKINKRVYLIIVSILVVGVRIDIWTHFMRECIINYVH